MKTLEKKYTSALIALHIISSLLVSVPRCEDKDKKPKFIFTEGVTFVTAADTEHYPIVHHLIASIYRYHAENLRAIAIFDLGLLAEERDTLNAMKNVHVYDIEPVNPFIFIKFRTRIDAPNGKPVRGLYSWKPVVIKQALEMFPYIMYLDAAMSLGAPVDLLFEYVKQHHYLLLGCGHSIRTMCTKTAEKVFSLTAPQNNLLNLSGLCGGIQILSRETLPYYVEPMYKLAHNFDNFVDDGTAPGGFGCGRHDQLLFSIQARLSKMHITSLNDRLWVEAGGEQYSFRTISYIKFKPSWWAATHD